MFTDTWGFTGKLGTSNDKSAVVDSRGRVFVVTGLRVIDACREDCRVDCPRELAIRAVRSWRSLE